MSCRKGITDFQWSLPHTVLPLQAHPDPPQVDLASAAAIGVAAAMTAIFRGQCPPCGGCAPPLGHSALPTFMFDWCHESCNSPRGYKATTTLFDDWNMLTFVALQPWWEYETDTQSIDLECLAHVSTFVVDCMVRPSWTCEMPCDPNMMYVGSPCQYLLFTLLRWMQSECRQMYWINEANKFNANKELLQDIAGNMLSEAI